MTGITSDKTSLPFPAPETKPLADTFSGLKDNQKYDSRANCFEKYLKSATPAKERPVRETGPKFKGHPTIGRRQDRDEALDKQDPATDSTRQTVGEGHGQTANEAAGSANVKLSAQDKADTVNADVKAQQQIADDDAAPDSNTVQTVSPVQAARSLNPVAWSNDAARMAGVFITDQSLAVNALSADTGNNLIQSQLTLGELVSVRNAETIAEVTAEDPQNNQTQQTAGGQQTAAALTQKPGLMDGQSAADSAQVLNSNFAVLMDESIQKTAGGPKGTDTRFDPKVAVSTDSQKGGGLNPTVLQVFQDGVAHRAAAQKVSHQKEELQHELQNVVVTGKMVTGAGSKPLNLAVLQTQTAVGENPDKISLPVAPLQQQQLPGGQLQEITGTATHVAGKDQLFGQIVENAKLMLAGGHSEMEMSLKPDNLGRLQLKVLVENQVVTARFVAESQQVKQIIENNLNGLREQLRENGLQADYLSVSVGTGTNDQRFDQAAGNQGHLAAGHDARVFADDSDKATAVADTASAPRPLRETVIDLIA